MGLRTHCESGTALYAIWMSMRQRCRNAKNKDYKYYGGKGVSICGDWNTYLGFKGWASSSGYRKGLEIDRRDNDGDYSPDNCRFITHTENIRNSSHTKLNWDKVCDIRMIRLHKGWSYEKLGATFNVTKQTIWAIIKNKIWSLNSKNQGQRLRQEKVKNY